MTQNVSIDLGEKGKIEGRVEPGFEACVDQFVANFNEDEEIGASVCIRHEGDVKLDLWGGIADPATGSSWNEDTVSIIFSCTKGIMALTAHMLISQGKLDPDQPVAEIWPEFATNGKENTTVRMMLDHTVGVPVFRDQVAEGLFLDWDKVTAELAAMAPYWEPGSNQGYHAVTFAWTVGELIRRVTGKTPGTIIKEFLAEPLGLDLYCGTPEEVEPRIAPMQTANFGAADPENLTPFLQKVLSDAESCPHKFLFNDGGFAANVNSRETHAAEIPSANGISNAKGLSGAYMPFALGGTYNGKTFVDERTLRGMIDVSAATNRDETLYVGTRFSMGFMKCMDNRNNKFNAVDSAIIGQNAFGHVGAGGSIGFADPDHGLSFGYNMNQMGAGILLNNRGQSLINEAYKAIGAPLD